MFITDLVTADAIPTLEASLRFAAQRQKLINYNIANISTPDFRPVDVSVRGFQETLADAVDRRRAATGGQSGELDWRETRELRRAADGGMRLVPRETGRNILFHDRNNRDLEGLLQDLVENTATHRIAADLLRSRYDLLRSAMSDRV